ncbi:HAD hydrolase-like protein [Amycolatopsis magusensis]|uniref:HAD hydrolase-like protein n=1 Tax=Amycolatopsis magusensis TaxID=882444 RepID=UPI0037BD1703
MIRPHFSSRRIYPSLLKPSAHLLRRATGRLRLPPAMCIYLGDSTTDMMAAQ